MTCQPIFQLQPLSEKTTWPFVFSRSICGRPAGRVQLQFLYSTRRYSVFPWSGDKSDLGRGGDCSLLGDTTLANSGGGHMLGEVWESLWCFEVKECVENKRGDKRLWGG